jgi:hypothetical protein
VESGVSRQLWHEPARTTGNQQKSGAEEPVGRDPDASSDTPATSADEPPTPVVTTRICRQSNPEKPKELAKASNRSRNRSRNSSRGTATASEPQPLD